MSIKLKKDLGLRDYLDLIAKQNEAIIDQLMIDPNAMTSAFRLTSHKQYKESIKDYTVAQETEKPKVLETKKPVNYTLSLVAWGILIIFGIYLLIQNGIL